MRNSFVFYKDWIDAISGLPNDIRLEVLDSIIEYAFSGKSPQLRPLAAMAFNFIKPQIDRNNQKFKNGCKGADYGALGGRPKNPEKTTKKPLKNPKKTPNENENDLKDEVSTDVDTLSENRDFPTHGTQSDSESESLVSQATPVNSYPVTGETLPQVPAAPLPKDEPINYRDLVLFFNAETKGVFGELRYPISEVRKTHVRARIREYGKNAFAEMIRKATRSDFLKGGNNRGFKATFDWMIKPSNFQKIIEGNYENRGKTGLGVGSAGDESLMQAIAAGRDRGIEEREKRKLRDQQV